jgi:tRNA(Ile)-lysidine synthetase-like protein
MVLLDILRKRPGVKLTVAHFDHGIRDDSHLDKKFVEQMAKSHGLPFVHGKGFLGPAASEATAREARYNFLHAVQNASAAKAIITAHHQDDLIETALLNILRGTGRRGLTSLKSTDGIIRPLLSHPKERIKTYASDNKIGWREDSTNADARYRRNYLRQNVMSKLTPGQRAQLYILLEDLATINDKLDAEIINMLHVQPALDTIERNWFIALPHDVSQEVLHFWLTNRKIKNLNRRRIDQLVTAIKTGKSNTVHEVNKKHKIHLTKTTAQIKNNV